MSNLLEQDAVPSSQFYRQSNRKLLKVGTRFGKVVVIDNTQIVVVGNKRKTRLSACLVLCDCGKEKIIDNRNLRGGFISSCGPCGRMERLPDSDWRVIWYSVRGRARLKNIEMLLTPLHIETIGTIPCVYCSKSPENKFHRTTWIGKRRVKSVEPTFLYSGIDRVDPSKGYIPGNVVPCCKFCNYAKMNRTLKEFLEQIARYGSTVTEQSVIDLAHKLAL